MIKNANFALNKDWNSSTLRQKGLLDPPGLQDPLETTSFRTKIAMLEKKNKKENNKQSGSETQFAQITFNDRRYYFDKNTMNSWTQFHDMNFNSGEEEQLRRRKTTKVDLRPSLV